MKTLTDQEFRDLLDWFMCSDPWPEPLGEEHHNRIRAMLNSEARERDYDGWVVAYHEHMPPEEAA